MALPLNRRRLALEEGGRTMAARQGVTKGVRLKMIMTTTRRTRGGMRDYDVGRRQMTRARLKQALA
jgi:hypothetical protein